MKRVVGAILAVFVCWQVLDFLIHGVLLMPLYEKTAELWRPQEEMKMGLMAVVTLLSSIAFVLIYSCLVTPKNLKVGIIFGALWGFAAGVSMGYGTFSFMPIPYYLALSWFLGTLVKGSAAGILVGMILKECVPEETAPM